MAEELVTIEINDQPYQVRKGAMLIEVADNNGITIPRFCYHKKLSIAANCRMCLVEMEKSPKPVPACATPVNGGMKFWTRSDKARNAQKAIMEFLLINHPLDCPICDQGGECELQDVSVGYGKSKSQYTEIKRVVKDKDIGPLIETEMTRCIQCTRCVRFGDEIAGMREMGGIGRGDRLEIGTYLEKSLKSELSGNVIDICPVGALTAKPSRYKARAWEMMAHESIAPHDSVGSNVELHTFRKELVRCVPRENEAINECWLSDRDRFSYQGVSASDRIHRPMIKRDGQWHKVTWSEALEAAAKALRTADPATTLAVANPVSTLEELYLFQRLMRGLNIRNIDHRLGQTDFADQDAAPTCPTLGMPISALENLNAALLVGSNVRQEQPLLNLRLRKAALKGAKITAVNPGNFDFNYPVTQYAVNPLSLLATLSGLAKAALEMNSAAMPEALASLLHSVDSTDADREAVKSLQEAANKAVLVGNIAVQHPSFSTIRALASVIAAQTGATFGYLVESANTVGAWLAGVVPHRLSAGRALKQPGLPVGDVLKGNVQTAILLNAEIADFANPQQALEVFSKAKEVVVIAPFADKHTREFATILLPGSTFAETSGTFCNVEGKWQSFAGVIAPVEEARPTWKILRVLGNSTGVPEFDWMTSEEVAAELRLELNGLDVVDNSYTPAAAPVFISVEPGFLRLGHVEMYASDPLVRRAKALQAMIAEATVTLNPQDADHLGVVEGDKVTVQQGNASVTLPVRLDNSIIIGCAGLPSGTDISNQLGAAYGFIQITKAG